jgi:predicted hotdog family 3-hydroxylacyl-ACP dehydratase
MRDVCRYIPHRPPMVLIDTIHDFADDRVTTTTHITPQAPFFRQEENGVPAWVGLEYMAQTAAVWIGLDDERCGREVEPAFLVSSRQFTASVPVFPAGETLYTQVQVHLVEQFIVVFNGRITNAEGELRAEALFTAYRPEDVRAYLSKMTDTQPTGETE